MDSAELDPPPASVQPWRKTGSRDLGNFRVFHLREDLSISPRTGREHPFIVLEAPDWVNVIATTPEDQIVLVKQFRHASETVELEIPGGVMDPTDASPVDAAIRELREETGYEGENARLIGSVFANPAILNNTCHTVWIQNCRPAHTLDLDHAEDLVTLLAPVADIPQWVAEGRFRHSLVVVALYHFDLLRRRAR